MPRLIMRRGPTPGAIYELEGDIIAIGRGSKNDIIIRDNEVSRDHCQMRRVMDVYEIQDLNSSNGTFVNGQRVLTTWLLQSGAIVELGDTITMEYDPGSPRASQIMPAAQRDIVQPADTVQQYSLMVTMGPEMGHVYRLDSMIVTIGRDLSNDIVIQDPEVSRFHSRLRRGSHGYSIEDMGSTNGTFVNGASTTQPYDLQPDDVIRLARQVRLQYVVRQETLKNATEATMIVGTGSDVRIFSEPKPENQFGHTAPLMPSGLLRATGRLTQTKTTGSLRQMNPSTPSQGTPIRQSNRLGANPQPGILSDSVFIAYARPDWDQVVSSLVSSLEQAGVEAWVDQYLIQQGDDWRAALEQALSECWAIVVVVSAQSLASNYVKMAYRYFATQRKPMLSFVLEPETTLPPDLAHARSIFYDRENPQRSYHKLILEIMHLRR